MNLAIALNLLGFGAVAIGFVGQFLSGKNRWGWLVGATSALMWTLPLAYGHVWSGFGNSLLSAGICIANFYRNRPEQNSAKR